MSSSTPVVVRRPACPIVGLSSITTLVATRERGTIRRMVESLLIRRDDITGRVTTTLLLVQLYPRHRRFTDTVPYR